jgi:hypothetical protein
MTTLLMLTTLFVYPISFILISKVKNSDFVNSIKSGMAVLFYTVFTSIIAFAVVSYLVLGIKNFYELIQSKSASTEISTNDSNPNKGYMTRQDDELLTATAIKQGHGEALTKSEQDFLDVSQAGKLGKPYDNRPDKSKDGQEP